MARTFLDPFQSLFNLQRALDASRSSDWLAGGLSGRGAYPPLNAFRQGDDFVIIAELPGISRKDVNVEVQGNRLRISGKKAIDYGEGSSLHRRERREGSFDRALTMPVEIDADGVKAEYRDGVLALFLPRAEKDRPKAITIN